MIYAYRSDTGLRKKNEDSFYIPGEGDIPVVEIHPVGRQGPGAQDAALIQQLRGGAAVLLPDEILLEPALGNMDVQPQVVLRSQVRHLPEIFLRAGIGGMGA